MIGLLLSETYLGEYFETAMTATKESLINDAPRCGEIVQDLIDTFGLSLIPEKQ